MNQPTDPTGFEDHWLYVELLPRYADLLQAHRDAATMYPQVAFHLGQCLVCQALLADLLRADDLGESKLIPADTLQFLRHPDQVQYIVAPGSNGQMFQAHIVLPISRVAEPIQVRAARGFGPIQPGGRLLLYDTILLGEDPVLVMLTLHGEDEAGQYTITGDLYADSLPPTVHARLFIGSHMYHAQVQDGRMSFENVRFDQDDRVERIHLTLETDNAQT